MDDIGELGQDVGEMTANLHENGFARYDNRVGNIIVDRSGIEDSEPVPYFIDGEYVETDAQEGDINLDLVAFMDSINDQDLEEFGEFFSGFREGCGQVPDSSIGLAGIRTVAERTLEKDFEKSVKAVMNTLTAFYINSSK